jgi:hypothetical protein
VCIALVCILEVVKMHTMMKTILLVKKRTMVKTILTTKRTMMMEFPKRMVKKMKKEKKNSDRSAKKGSMSALSSCVPPRLHVSHSCIAMCMEHGHYEHHPKMLQLLLTQFSVSMLMLSACSILQPIMPEYCIRNTGECLTLFVETTRVWWMIF